MKTVAQRGRGRAPSDESEDSNPSPTSASPTRASSPPDFNPLVSSSLPITSVRNFASLPTPRFPPRRRRCTMRA